MMTDAITNTDSSQYGRQLNDWCNNVLFSGKDNGYTLSQHNDQPSWLKPVVDKLIQFIYLKEDWNSYGAKAINHRSIELAVDLLLNLANKNTPEPSVVANPSGYVQLEWHVHGVDLEVELISPTRVYVDYEDGENSGWDEELDYDFSKLSESISILSNRQLQLVA